MVKRLDEIPRPRLIDHIGWRLTRLSRKWKGEFDAAMVARGHAWMTQAPGQIVGHLRETGVPQGELAALMGVSKQAVQQHVDALVELGVVERVTDAADARSRIVQLTHKGAQALADANAVKLEIEDRYRAALGGPAFANLEEALDQLFEME
ncbi:MarR family winged helix-turn-helix transcriptional regulator [Devosia lacusdianchii]|uniref:MarR family winged helix-turn-helix transcriptional regulator n=1 Tax=Devosia lacusdianchii TaxID=2917991 RepID=UPI001F053900|nr:MarR family transcriptional regulator [Devosia sp. JXJ CY 41]